MRELIFDDVFKMSKILKKIDVKNKLADMSGMSQEQAGAQMIIAIFENLDEARDEINNFMGSLVDMTGEEFRKLPVGECMKYIAEFKDLPGVEGFFKSAGQLMK